MPAPPAQPVERTRLLHARRRGRLTFVTLESLFSHVHDLPFPDHPLDPKVLPAHGGVFAFSDEAGRLIQLLGAQNIRRSAFPRLSADDDEPRAGRRARLREVARRVWWLPTGSVFETTLRYLQLARVLLPDDYREHLSFGPVWFARALVGERAPYWIVNEYALDGRAVDIGPFATRQACNRFLEMLVGAFDLCRHTDVLKRSPNGQACAYHDMGRCPAPCNGTASLVDYRTQFDASMRFAAGDTGPWRRSMELRMNAAAAAREFESAGRIKGMLDDVRKQLAQPVRFSATPDHFRFLIVQRAVRRRQVKPFFVVAGRISEDEPVDIRDVPDLMERWTSRITVDIPSDPGTAGQDSEHIWLVSHFLNKAEAAKGVYLGCLQSQTVSSATDVVVRYFS